MAVDGSSGELEHARRRLEPFLPEAENVDLAGLFEVVEQDGAA
jgi:hypothetical protein